MGGSGNGPGTIGSLRLLGRMDKDLVATATALVYTLCQQ